jgi:protein phosphatase
VGDCRIYLWREGRVDQITQDHSVAAQLAREGFIDETEIAQHPRSNVILRAVGHEVDVLVDVFKHPLKAGDKLLLCSDGLWKSLSDQAELAHWLGQPITAADLCRQLVTEAKTRDGSDNISAIVASLNEGTGC